MKKNTRWRVTDYPVGCRDAPFLDFHIDSSRPSSRNSLVVTERVQTLGPSPLQSFVRSNTKKSTKNSRKDGTVNSSKFNTTFTFMSRVYVEVLGVGQDGCHRRESVVL